MTMISKHLLKEQKKIYTIKKSTAILKSWKSHTFLTSRSVCYRTPRLVKVMSTIGKEWEWTTQWLEEKLLPLWWNKCVYKWLLSTLTACRANRQGYPKHPPFISYLPESMAASHGQQMSPSQRTHARHSSHSSRLSRPTGSAPVRPPLRKLFYTELLWSQEVRRSGSGKENISEL